MYGVEVDDQAELTGLLLAIGEARQDARLKGLGRAVAALTSTQCPLCRGTLRYTIDSEGRVPWGHCDSPGCVEWSGDKS